MVFRFKDPRVALNDAYAAAATMAAAGSNAIIVETRPEHEADWKAALDAINPNLAYILCSVRPRGHA